MPCWHAGIEADLNNTAIRDALWFRLHIGMRRDEVLIVLQLDALRDLFGYNRSTGR